MSRDESMPYSGHREIYQHVRFVLAQQQCRQWCMRSHRNERKTFFFSFSFSIYRLVKGVVCVEPHEILNARIAC